MKHNSKKAKAAEPDFSALDEAVSELSKQTAALLGSADSTANKPELPKRRNQPVAKGRSLDIVTVGSHRPAVPAHLRTVKEDKPASLEASEAQQSTEDAGVEKPKADGQPEIILHRRGKLSLPTVDEGSDDQDQVTEQSTQEDETNLSAEEKTADDNTGLESSIDNSPEISAESQRPLTFASDGTAPASAEEASVADTSSRDSKDEPTDAVNKQVSSPPESIEAPADAPKKPEEAITTPELVDSGESGELFANNLVTQSDPKRYQPHEAQHKPTVFDTNEYHPELHDWSKLDNRSSGKVFVLIVLLAIAGFAAYWVLSGKSIPFV